MPMTKHVNAHAEAYTHLDAYNENESGPCEDFGCLGLRETIFGLRSSVYGSVYGRDKPCISDDAFLCAERFS
eukprot:1373298-Amorphochlora_amoeboformis.AAC.1